MAFIVLEGGEGVGKTTQITLLKERLSKFFSKRTFVFTKEPGGSPLAEKIREIVLSDAAAAANGKTMFGLFTAARFDHVATVIAPALERGEIVICDRFVAATYAYQIVAQESPDLLPLFTEHLKLLEPTLPDLTLILDLDPAVALERLAKRRGQAVTHYDTRDLGFHKRLREGYREYAEKYAKGKCVFIDASRSIEEMHQDILAALKGVLA